MPKITLTIRGIDADLIKQARTKAINHGMRISEWLNEAIQEKLVKHALDDPYDLDKDAKPTKHEGVFWVPYGTVHVGVDYTIAGRRLCAAGRKEEEEEEVVTYKSPSTINDLGYQLFWIR